jgi:hypothetical protein
VTGFLALARKVRRANYAYLCIGSKCSLPAKIDRSTLPAIHFVRRHEGAKFNFQRTHGVHDAD